MINRTLQKYSAFRSLIMVAVGCYSSMVMAASNTIESINVSALPGDKTLIKIHLQKPATKPTGFSVATPPRIALDFADVANGVPVSSQPAPQGNLRAVNLVEVGGRTRLVLSLLQNAPYEVATDGQDVLVSLAPVGATTASTAATAGVTATVVPSVTSAAPVTTGDAIQDIEFRKGQQGEGRVIIDLARGSAGVDIRQQGKLLVVDISKGKLPENLRRRMDVTDFGTPVQFVEAKDVGANTRITIEPKGNWEYSSYQTDNKLVVELKEASSDRKPTQARVYSGEKLSLNFQNVDVRSVIAVLADFTGMNIITSDTVTGNLTLRLKDVPWDQAFDIVLQAKGLDSRKKGNVVLVAPREELATKEKLELETQQSITELEPLKTEVFQINYQKAKVVYDFLKDEKYPFLSKRGSVIVDERTNQIFLKEIPSKLEEFRDLLTKIDVPTRQVMIEARIVIADQDFSGKIGGALSYKPSSTGSRGLWGSKDTTISSGSGLGGGSAPSLSSTDGGSSFLLSLTHSPTGEVLSLALSALELDNKGKIISSPRVVTLDQAKATIKQGFQVPYKVCSTGTTVTCTTSFKDVVLSLDVTPQITPDNRVSLVIVVNKDTLGALTDAGYIVNTNQVTTQALLANGDTTVIGGIYEEVNRNDISKTPVLGDIPVFGWLFKTKSKTDTKTELMIFITPRILDDRLAVR
ncbi:type IV pilus secretin PilQ [Leeia oryzae]|uniref:type IV pilus secretin PilQ n=1 Tax=Leeia oryzae TaxID=356662 RepID=UPI00035F7A2F|nr:type IV pilus secretin PilQ [Leeia oryzae]